MKKIFLPGVFLALLFILSCSKDEFTEDDATQAQKEIISYQDSITQVRDSLNMVGGIIQYSVSVVPIDGSSAFAGGFKSGKATDFLAGATVSVSQHGVVLTDSTGDSGIAVFNDLRVGTVNVNVQVEDYTSVSFVAEIKPENDPNVNVYYDVLRHAATMVPVFSLTEGTSTIEGQVTYESDLTNAEPEVAEDVTVIAMVDVDDAQFIDNYFLDIWGDELEKYNGKIVQIAYTDLTATGVTDENGEYSLTMPSTADGLPVMMEIGDFAVDQQLLMNTVNGEEVHGIQSIRTIFSTSTTNPSDIHDVPAAYVEFSAPTGVDIQQPVEKAQATAVIGESGISSIIIQSQGSGYTQPPIVEIDPGTGNGEGAEAVAYISDGKLTKVEITKPGKGYSQADGISVNLIDKEGDNAAATPVMTYSVVDFTVTPGDGYLTKPDVIINSSTGSGASGEADVAGYVSEVTVTNMGSGYVAPPEVVFKGNADEVAIATADMTEFNPIHSIELTDQYEEMFETVPDIEIQTTGGALTGSGATAQAQLSSSGGIDRVELSNAGLGYDEAPAVIITGGGGTGAVAEATLNVDGSINVEVLASGQGYTSVPTVEITAPPTGGTQAVGTAIWARPISKITLTNPGSGYNINYTGVSGDRYNNEPVVEIDGDILDDDEVIVRPDMSVESIGFTSPGDTQGEGYETAPTVTITPAFGYGSGATATANILYRVVGVEVTNPGSGYGYNADIEVIISTPASGDVDPAKATAILGDGVLSEIILDDGGEGYLAPPIVTLTNTTIGAPDMEPEITAQISNGAVTGFTIQNGGSGYSYDNPNDFNININTYGSAGSLEAVPYTQSGKISFITIDDPGAGYTTEPMVRFVRKDGSGDAIINHGFVDAEATPVLEDGRVVAIDITNPGTGYYYKPDIEIYVPDYLEVAKAEVNVNDDGYIDGIVTGSLNGGMGYATAPTVTFHPAIPGMGTGATATAVVQDGAVVDVVMSNNGSGYLGKNYKAGTTGLPIVFKPTGAALSDFPVYAGKTYIRDIYLGSGLRTIEE